MSRRAADRRLGSASGLAVRAGRGAVAPSVCFAPALALCLSAATAVHAQPAQQPPRASAPAARATADEALDAGRLEQARTAYAEAFARHPSFDLAGNLGAVELALGHHEDAVEHLGYALAHLPPDASAAVKRALEARLSEAEQHAGRPKTATAAPDSSPTVVRPSAPTESLDRAASPPTDEGPSPVVIAAGLGLTVAAAAAGAALVAMSASRGGLAADKQAALDALALPDPCTAYPFTCDEIQSKQDARDAFAAGAGVAFGVAGAAAIGTLVYALVAGSGDDGDDRGAAPTAGPVELIPGVAGATPGLTIARAW